MNRYQMVLAPCTATQERSWGQVMHTAPSIISMWDEYGPRGHYGLSWDQVVVIKDALKGTEMTEEEYRGIVARLKGWK